VLRRLELPKPFLVSFDAEDDSSPIARAEYSLDAGPWQYVDPAGKISDSKHEHYDSHLAGRGGVERSAST
jgi:hypothetical protein